MLEFGHLIYLPGCWETKTLSVGWTEKLSKLIGHKSAVTGHGVCMCVCVKYDVGRVLVITVASIVVLALVWNNLFTKIWGLSPQAPDTRRLCLHTKLEVSIFTRSRDKRGPKF